MNSPLHNRERVDLARSFRTTVFPVGQPVVVRITHKLSSENRAAVQLRYLPSADAYSSRVSDDWPGGLNPSNALPAFFDRTRGTIPVDLNLFGPFQAARRSFRALLKFCQEPSRRFTKCFKAPSCAVFHDTQHGENDVAEIRKSLGEVRNVVR
jgi:hypothetical protein